MKKTALALAVCSLAACGGSSTDSSPPKNAQLAMRASQRAAQHAPSEYNELIQRIYLAFFGRPADSGGLPYWGQVFSDHNMPLTLGEIIAAYPGNTDVRTVVDYFANSPESKQLYTGSNADFINAVYLNAFNRYAEAGGRAFWSGFLDRGQITRSQAAMWIWIGAQNDDAVIAAKKLQAAGWFTAALDTPSKGAAYSGANANDAVRDMLGGITVNTDMTAFKADIDAFVNTFPGTFPVVARYSGYGYLQDLNGVPAYSAAYSYTTFGVVTPGLSGTLTFGVQPQKINWTRDTGTNVLNYASVFTASSVIPATGTLPVLAMLCRDPGVGLRSTDILASRNARLLTDATQLAGQTLNLYRENCAAGSNTLSVAFDAAGNVTLSGPDGVAAYTASAFTKTLNGETLVGVKSGTYLQFVAYSYAKSDGSTAYALVQHAGTTPTVPLDGSLSLWSQE